MHTYSESTTNAKWLVALSSRASNEIIIPENAHEVAFPLLFQVLCVLRQYDTIGA